MLRIFLLSGDQNFNPFPHKTITLLLVFAFSITHAFAQKPARVAPKTKADMKRCGTMEGLEERANLDPDFRAILERNERDYQNWLNNPSSSAAGRPSSPASLPGPVTIPVVVHIVLPNPWIISDQSVQAFINRLNEDFSGLNADSANCSAGNFCNLRGHSLLRFTLAKRDPQGRFTTGIIRKNGTTVITGGAQPIKNSNTASGGSTGWDISKYYNVYVGDGGAAGLLGISPGIGPGSATLGNGFQDGVCVDYRCFGDYCFSYDEYRLSRTTVHEIGHNFGLYHIWGDNNPCVTGTDFRQLGSAGCSLPPALLGPNDDTPNQSGSTGGCPGNAIANGCNPPIAKMFQNYMDYTDDGCYSMFTIGQVKRMEYVLEFCRNGGYLTTLGGQLPTGYPMPLDGMLHSIVSPGGFEGGIDSDCNPYSTSYPVQTCEGNFVPKIRIYNSGTTAINNITVTTNINGLNERTQTVAVNIPAGKYQIVTLAPQTAVPGVNNLFFQLSSPNGGVDGNLANDTMSYRFTVATPIALPYTENFTNLPFPPNNGTVVVNPDGPEPTPADGSGIGWKRSINAGRPGPASMWMNCYAYQTVGERDLYKMPPVNTNAIDSIKVSFYYAYRQYFGDDVETPPNDSLKLLYSTDCGASWQELFSKGGPDLSTVNGTTDSSFRPYSPGFWKKESFVLGNLCALGAKNVLFAFESYNDFGNNIWVDSINIVGFNAANTNATIFDITSPGIAYCSTTLSPTIVLGNAGKDTLRTVNISYSVDGGTPVPYNWSGALGKCESEVITLATVSNLSFTPHRITFYTSNPNGTADDVPANDTLYKDFVVFNTLNTPIVEDFNGNVFPPANWGGINLTGGTTWERRLVTNGAYKNALLMNNADPRNRNNAVDYFISPIVDNSASFDSVHVDFDLAYRPGRNYPGSTVLPLDTLEILASNDCGTTFTSVWKKWGDALQTINDPNYAWDTSFVPNAGEWKRQRAYLSPFVGSDNFQLYFAMKGNKQNKLWIDNINISSQTLPQKLKDQGYLIYPNPFNGTFRIHHHGIEPPVDLQAVLVYNASGQTVWSKEYNGNADRQIFINMGNAANGMYILKMIYTNRTVIERIVKAQ